MTVISRDQRIWLVRQAGTVSFFSKMDAERDNATPEDVDRLTKKSAMQASVAEKLEASGNLDTLTKEELEFCLWAVRGLWKFAAARVEFYMEQRNNPVGLKASRKQARFLRALFIKLGGDVAELKLKAVV